MRAFESGLLTLMRTKHTDLLDSIRKSGDLSDADATKLKGCGRRLRQDIRLTAA